MADPAHARGLLLEACQLQYTPAIYTLGEWFRLGLNGCQKNLNESVRLFQIGATRGDAKSQLALAELFVDGNEVVPRNEAMAFKLVKNASDQDLSTAQFTLGNFL